MINVKISGGRPHPSIIGSCFWHVSKIILFVPYSHWHNYWLLVMQVTDAAVLICPWMSGLICIHIKTEEKAKTTTYLFEFCNLSFFIYDYCQSAVIGRCTGGVYYFWLSAIMMCRWWTLRRGCVMSLVGICNWIVGTLGYLAGHDDTNQAHWEIQDKYKSSWQNCCNTPPAICASSVHLFVNPFFLIIAYIVSPFPIASSNVFNC